MNSDAKDVSLYLEEVPDKRRESLTKLRQLCLECLPDHTEDMRYGMPSYSKDDVVDVAFASQKSYISLYILKQDVMEEHRPLLEGLSVGKGCIRYKKPEKIDFDVVRIFLEGSHLSSLEACAPIPESESSEK